MKINFKVHLTNNLILQISLTKCEKKIHYIMDKTLSNIKYLRLTLSFSYHSSQM